MADRVDVIDNIEYREISVRKVCHIEDIHISVIHVWIVCGSLTLLNIESVRQTQCIDKVSSLCSTYYFKNFYFEHIHIENTSTKNLGE